jgi:hypothetical protein
VARDDFLLSRLVTYAALAAGLFGAILALVGCVIATVAGSPPSPGLLAAIVIGVGVAFALLARFLIRRIPWLGVALFAGRRIWRWRSRGRGRGGA